MIVFDRIFMCIIDIDKRNFGWLLIIVRLFSKVMTLD